MRALDQVIDQFVTATSVAEIERGINAGSKRCEARVRITASRCWFDDALIADADSVGMTTVTLSIAHFEPLGVPLLNLWHMAGGSGRRTVIQSK